MSKKTNTNDRMRVAKKGTEMAYVTDQGKVAVVKKGTQEVIVTLPDNVKDLSQTRAISLDGSKSYVIRGTEILVTDTRTKKAITAISFGMGEQWLSGILMIPGGTKAYVTVGDGNCVFAMDTATDGVEEMISVGQSPGSMATTADGAWVYVRNHTSWTLSVIDAKTKRVVDTIPVRESGTGPAKERGSSRVATVTKAKDTAVEEDEMATIPEDDVEALPLLGGKATVKSKVKAACATALSLLIAAKVKATITVSVSLAIVVAVVVTVEVVVVMPTKPAPPQCKVPVAYVANYGGNTISVIDTNTNLVLETIAVGAAPYAIAVTPDGTRAYVTNSGSNTVSVIDTAANSVLTTIQVNQPYGVAVSPDGTWVYVANYRSNSFNMISAIDTVTHQIMFTIPLSVSGYLSAPIVVVTPDGTRAYVAYAQSSSVVSVIDIIKRSELAATIPVGSISSGIAVTPDGTQIYVAASSNSGTYVINTATNQVKAVVPLPDSSLYSRGVTVSSDGKRAYVTNFGSGNGNTVTVIDAANNLVLANIRVGPAYTMIRGVAVSLDGTRVYSVNEDTNTVFVIDAVTNEVSVDTISVGSSPRAITTASIPC
jgi:YVTN family beta-propeller protein